MTSAYVITYRYVRPGPAGPFKGRATESRKYAKGETIWAVFGEAVVTSCREKKEAA